MLHTLYTLHMLRSDLCGVSSEQDFPVSELLRDGDNLLRVDFVSPVLYASERQRAHSAYRVPPECPPDVQKGECHVNFIRKVSVCQEKLSYLSWTVSAHTYRHRHHVYTGCVAV